MKSLIVDGVNKSYGKHHVLKDVSFSLRAGEVLGFIGPNGSGKSTTMKCIASLVFPDSGRIEIAGYDLFKARSQALSHISVLIEAPGLYFNLTGLENLKLFAGLRNIPKGRLQEVAELTGLGPALGKSAGSYSMGMKQRLALAVAMLPKPTFLILDEPFSGLDVQGVFELRGLIKSLSQEGCGIIFSSHQLIEMEKLSSRNIFIRKGAIVPQEQAAMDVAVLSYRLDLTQWQPDLSILDRLKVEGLLEEFHLEAQAIFIILSDAKHFTAVLSTIMAGCHLRGVVPLTANIENLYSQIYNKELI